MKIISYNVNGIRAAINKGLVDWLAEAQPDVLCLQETKARPEQVDTTDIEKLELLSKGKDKEDLTFNAFLDSQSQLMTH